MPEIVVKQLPCGMPLICERMDGVKSLGLSWLLPFGSAHDPADRLGMSAMLSQLLFRGAGELDSRAQADALDRLGVGRGCETQTFRLALSATMLGSNLAGALPLLVDAVRRPRIDEASFDAVKDLCLQAIERLDDDPQSKVMLNLRAAHAPEPVNRSGMGTPEGLEAITREELRAAWESRARPGGSVLALAGEVDPEHAYDLLASLLDGWTGTTADPEPSGSPPRGYAHETQDTAQVHIALAHDAPAERDASATLERVVTAALSGGMSGRLFTEVREKRSLCYSVSASYGTDRSFGRVAAYVGTTPERAQQALEVLWGELTRVNAGIDQSELDRALVGMQSTLVMSGESSSARASAIAQDYRKIGRPRTLEERIDEIGRVTLKSVNGYLATRRLGACTVATIGPAALDAPRGISG